MRILLIALVATTSAIADAAHAQVKDEQAWFTVAASGKVDDHVVLSLEALGRFGDAAAGLYEAEFGGFIGYRLDNGVEFGFGYVNVPGYSHGDRTRVENRLRQQVSFPLGSLGAAKLSGRVRLEERFRNTGADTGFRLRPQVKAALPLGDGGVSLFAGHESFLELNDTDWGQDDGYARMRNTIGVKVPLFGAVSGSVAYLNQLDFGRGGERDRMAHIADIGLSLGF
ncbi:DUF2490 domain-containing protein [Stakelama saccharophila]|uniref:DUF2490 domain-containing protein n=1 Tax=Stakelama saccharophila TaxID=3075605 RepID=A0ABZ0B7F4_9SPHN|nr:DUF2490 domain-containing protein [Stakelama sp. W311]WNO53346.1 DUF2490 domain-containing protein [Stakelama sp. W311]